MATIKHFEDLVVWQKARELCQIVDTLISKPAFIRSYTLKFKGRKTRKELAN